MSGYGRGGEDPRAGRRPSSSSSHPSQQRRAQPTHVYPSLNAPAASSHDYPLYATPAQYPAYASGYLMSPPTPYPQQPSIHAGYPTLAYPSYPHDAPPSPAYAPPFRYPSPMSPAYAAPYPTSYPSPHAYPAAAYPHAPEGDGGTWWYVPPQQQQQQPYDAPGFPFYPTPPPPEPHAASAGPSQPPPTHARGSTPSSGAASLPPASPSPAPALTPARDASKPLVRRAYHPNPPAHRSEWVMWAGNVPSDAGHDELWRFFTSGSADASSDATGVLSIFLISRSSCAFVNYASAAQLEHAIRRFNGVPLRPADPRCARLLCRVRRKDDDLRAGVGGQRGIGMHTRWVKEKREKEAGKEKDREDGSDSGTSGSDAARSLSALSLRSDDVPARPPPRPVVRTAGSASSGSFASTNSSLLTRHFPQRFFILKSLTRDDLDLSVRTGVWATQKHNEGVLDRAFRTAQDVFLVFSVNKSGEFYGYARMAGPVGHGEGGRVAWAARGGGGGSGSEAGSPTAPRGPTAAASHPVPAARHPVTSHAAPLLLSAERLVDASPAPFPTPTSSPLRPPDVQSAPAVMGPPPRQLSVDARGAALKYSLDHGLARGEEEDNNIKLDPVAPIRAMRSEDAQSQAAHELRSVAEEEHADGEPGAAKDVGAGTSAAREDWGQDFKLQWLCTARLPFQRTRHIRNPWNHDREVKVSRDGTELEPGVGAALLEEWRTYAAGEEAGGVQQMTPLSETGPTGASGRVSGRAGAGTGTGTGGKTARS
ncbi:YT521-B-like domain-containing protein [Mycena belliarum]|uniref:YT521-B-like domain-containing protein n=1 Tax=Mycena belliarum TaxID=1033014 RepID=A0AAD6TPV6_9AGAR|nr:YT521-B-like domain-containing protein [Mycena belliae]